MNHVLLLQNEHSFFFLISKRQSDGYPSVDNLVLQLLIPFFSLQLHVIHDIFSTGRVNITPLDVLHTVHGCSGAELDILMVKLRVAQSCDVHRSICGLVAVDVVSFGSQ